jgi:hypothetical protein
MAKRSSSIIQRRGSTDPSADAALAKLGYASELPRNLSMISVLGMYVYSNIRLHVIGPLSTTLFNEESQRR